MGKTRMKVSPCKGNKKKVFIEEVEENLTSEEESTRVSWLLAVNDEFAEHYLTAFYYGTGLAMLDAELLADAIMERGYHSVLRGEWVTVKAESKEN